jgi:KDO2-lipid IV(A) lauroyltransferase
MMAKDLLYRAQAALIRLILWLGQLLPLPLRAAMVGHVVNGAVRMVPFLRRRALHNMALAMPETDAAARNRILGQVARNVGRTLTEILFNTEFAQTAARSCVTGPGLAVLEAAKARGQGAIIVSGHFGQWEAIRHVLKVRGLETGAIYRPNNNPYYEPMFVRGITAGGAPIIARGPAGSRAMLRHIRNGGFIALLMDQFAQDGTILSFMGQPAVTSLSAADLALRYDLPLVPAFGTRTPQGIVVDIEDPIAHTDAATMMQVFNDRLALRVRANPGQWHWLHDRFKVFAFNRPATDAQADD